MDEFLSFIKDKKLIIHNAEFDLSHLNNELAILGKQKINSEKNNLPFPLLRTNFWTVNN